MKVFDGHLFSYGLCITWFSLVTILFSVSSAQYVFIEQPANEDVPEGHNVTLTCAINFHPNTVMWLWNGSPLIQYNASSRTYTSSDLRHTVEEEEMKSKVNFHLHLHNLTLQDSGIYHCVIESIVLTPMTSRKANVTVNKPPTTVNLIFNSVPIFTREVHIYAGIPTDISCQTTASKPPANLKWKLSNVDLSFNFGDDMNFVYSNGNSLDLFDTILLWKRPFFENDTGKELECHVMHPGLKLKLVSKMLLKVNCSTCKSFYFVHQPENTIVRENESVIIPCQTSFPLTEVTWYKDGYTLFTYPGEDSSFPSDVSLSGDWYKGEANLYIENVKVGIHEGIYRCDVISLSNQRKSLRSNSAELSVITPLQIQYKTRETGRKWLNGEIRVTENKIVLLKCSTEGTPSNDYEIQWIFQKASGEILPVKEIPKSQKGNGNSRSLVTMKFTVNDNNITIGCAIINPDKNITYFFVSERLKVLCEECLSVIFRKEPEDQIIMDDIGKVEVDCEINTSILSVTWFIGKEIYQVYFENNVSQSIKKQMQNGIGTLSTEPHLLFLKQTEVKVRCQVSYGHDSSEIITSQSAILRYIKSDQFYIPTIFFNNRPVSGEIHVREKETVFIKCIIYNSLVIPNIQWKIGNHTVVDSNDLILKKRDDSLGYDLIKPFNNVFLLSDNGVQLTCQVAHANFQNGFGIQIKVFCTYCQIYDVSEITETNFPSLVYGKNLQNDFTIFKYQLNFVPLSYEYLKNDIPFKSGIIKNYVYDPNTILIKYSVLLKLLDDTDKGTYMFRFYYGLGPNDYITTRPKLVNIGNFTQFTLRINGSERTEVRMQAGDIAQVECQADGYPQSIKWWFLNGEYKGSSSMATQENDGKSYSLIGTFRFSKEDRFIACRVDFGNNQIAEKRIRLTIFDGEPVKDFLFEPDDLQLQLKKDGKLVCKVNFLLQKIEWFKNDLLIYSSTSYSSPIPRITFQNIFNNGESILFFSNSEAHLHTGLYHCYAYYTDSSYIVSRQGFVYHIIPPTTVNFGFYADSHFIPIDHQLEVHQNMPFSLICKTFSYPETNLNLKLNVHSDDDYISTNALTYQWNNIGFETQLEMFFDGNYNMDLNNITCEASFQSASSVTKQIKIFCIDCVPPYSFLQRSEDRMFPLGVKASLGYIVNFTPLDITVYKNNQFFLKMQENYENYSLNTEITTEGTKIGLFIKHTQFSDNGHYYMKLNHGTDETNFILSPVITLTIFKKPELILFLANDEPVFNFVQYTEGDKVEIRCQATGSYPETELQLIFKENEQLQDDGHYNYNTVQNLDDSETLDSEISMSLSLSTAQHDLLELICKANHAAFEEAIEKFLIIRVRCKNCNEYEFVKQPEDITTSTSTSFILPCKTKFQLPFNRIFWYKNNDLMMIESSSLELYDHSVSQSSNGDLIFHNGTPGRDDGQYYCQAFYGNGLYDYIISKVAQVTIQRMPSDVWVSNYDNLISEQLIVEAYSSVYLNCKTLNAKPVPLLSWQLDGTSIPLKTQIVKQSTAYMNLFDSLSAVELFVKPQHNNSTVSCNISHPSIEVPYLIPVKLNILSGIKNVTIEVIKGKDLIILRCLVTNFTNPSPTFKWVAAINASENLVGNTADINIQSNCSEGVKYSCSGTNIVNNKVYTAKADILIEELEICKQIKANLTELLRANKERMTNKSDSHVGAIFGGIFGGIILILLLLLIPLLIYKKKHGKNKSSNLANLQNGVPKYDTNTKSYSYVFSSENAPEFKQLNSNCYENPFEAEDWSDPPNLELKLISKISDGRIGDVHLAVASDHMKKGELLKVAVKILKGPTSQHLIAQFVTEIQLHRMLTIHPNVVIFIGNYKRQDELGMVLEYLQNGDLRKFLQRNCELFLYGPPFSDDEELATMSRQLLTFSWQIAKGMDHIARHRIVHRDLATRNILLDGNMNCKVSDFGMARIVNDNKEYLMNSVDPVPIRWMAPESLADRRFSTKSDIWSFGITIWEIITLGATPYPEFQRSVEVIRKVKSGYIMKKPTHCKYDLYGIMAKCWRTTPDNRPSFNDLIKDFEDILSGDKDYINFLEYDKRSYEQVESETFSELVET